MPSNGGSQATAPAPRPTCASKTRWVRRVCVCARARVYALGPSLCTPREVLKRSTTPTSPACTNCHVNLCPRPPGILALLPTAPSGIARCRSVERHPHVTDESSHAAYTHQTPPGAHPEPHATKRNRGALRRGGDIEEILGGRALAGQAHGRNGRLGARVAYGLQARVTQLRKSYIACRIPFRGTSLLAPGTGLVHGGLCGHGTCELA